jgi:RHS repeat-associated protein
MVYSAWGETRYSFGATPTDRLYTGQYEAEAGLYFYNARWYDNYLNHFVQPDTIIPDPSNPQSWNRYAYVNNNPINYNDPSGHYEFEDNPDDPYWLPAVNGIMTSRRSTKDFAYTTNERRGLIVRRANILATRENDSLVASTELIRYSTSLYSNGDTYNFMMDITCVINGYCSNPIGVFRLGLGFTKDRSWWLNYDVFQGKGSWSSNYYDFTNNQLYHFWFYVATSYMDGYPLALVANFTHDPPIDILEINGRIVEGFSGSPWITELAENGRSYQDYLLGKAGAKLGLLINAGSINPNEVADWMWRELSGP